MAEQKEDRRKQHREAGWEEAAAAVAKLCREETEKRLVIAIDGKSGSGKSTLAGCLCQRFGGNLFHMDDFFLRPEQRTDARLAQVGGNVDYERFAQVLEQIRCGGEICYRPYDCGKQELTEPVKLIPHRLNLVEGSYSMHPYFGDAYDLTITVDIGAKEQTRRILERNGAAMLARFEEEWIPKENAYLEKFGIFEKSDLHLY